MKNIEVKFYKKMLGRDYYKSKKEALYFQQPDGYGLIKWFYCSSDGEPEDKSKNKIVIVEKFTKNKKEKLK